MDWLCSCRFWGPPKPFPWKCLLQTPMCKFLIRGLFLFFFFQLVITCSLWFLSVVLQVLWSTVSHPALSCFQQLPGFQSMSGPIDSLTQARQKPVPQAVPSWNVVQHSPLFLSPHSGQRPPSYIGLSAILLVFWSGTKLPNCPLFSVAPWHLGYTGSCQCSETGDTKTTSLSDSFLKKCDIEYTVQQFPFPGEIGSWGFSPPN